MMVRKAISFSLIILVLLLAYQFVVNFFKSNHTIDYSIEDFYITEDYIKDDEEYYLFRIRTKDDKEFIFEKENEFNKQRQVIQNVLEYSDEDVYCISLKYKNIKENTEPQCYKDGEVYSYKEISKYKNIDDFVKKLNNTTINKYKNESTKKTEEGVEYHPDYFTDDEILIVFDRSQLGFFFKNYIRHLQFSNVDNKSNVLGAVVGDYYLIPRFVLGDTFNTYIKYDIDAGYKVEMNMIYRISTNSYINGVYKNKLYIFDRTAMKQYEINPYSDEVTIVGEVGSKGFAYINGKIIDVSVEEMAENEILFSENKDAYQNIQYDDIYLTKKYAIYSIDGRYYKVYKKYPNNPILLFTGHNLKELKIVNDNIYFILNNSIYRYNESGIVELAKKQDLEKNPYNSFDIYFR